MLKQVGLIDTLQSIRHQHLVDTLHALHKYGHVPNPISRHASSRRAWAAGRLLRVCSRLAALLRVACSPYLSTRALACPRTRGILRPTRM